MNARTLECPLCSTDFNGSECHSSCPMSRGCSMVRCPRCGYEFVESGRFLDMLLRWIRRAPAAAGRCEPAVMKVSQLPLGAFAAVESIFPSSAARVNRLASFGILAGSEVRLVARRPAVVLACGPSTIALDDEVAADIYVRVTPSPLK